MRAVSLPWQGTPRWRLPSPGSKESLAGSGFNPATPPSLWGVQRFSVVWLWLPGCQGNTGCCAGLVHRPC